MNETEIFRSNHLVDPQLHVWGWEIPVYLFLGGLAAGIMILSGLLAMRVPRAERSRWIRWMPFVAPVALSLGMFSLWLDLENPFNVHRFYMTMQPTSAMSWGSWILLAIYPATVLFGLSGVSDDEAERLSRVGLLRRLRLTGVIERLRTFVQARESKLRWANVGLGVLLGGYTGILLATMAARAAWSSMLLGPLFLVSGLSTGAALMMLFPLKHEEHAAVRRWDMWAIGVELLLLGLFFMGLVWNGGAAGREAAGLFLGGPYTAWFWALVVAAGLLAPLLLETTESKRRLRPTLAAPALILAGGLALRWILVAAGQA